MIPGTFRAFVKEATGVSDNYISKKHFWSKKQLHMGVSDNDHALVDRVALQMRDDLPEKYKRNLRAHSDYDTERPWHHVFANLPLSEAKNHPVFAEMASRARMKKVAMTPDVFRAFVKEALALEAGGDTPPDYLPTRLALAARFPKLASNLVNALEVGGLGILARPSYQNLRKPNANAEEKSHAKHELAGLGVLAAHPAYELGHAAVNKAKSMGMASKIRRAATVSGQHLLARK